ncbi:MAG: TRAP transporter large permease subunit [Deltaproteobacteria bacterium]|nr:TRAP transporter large permease subunit [Deltaproteobacteria bacterium]
MSAVAVVKKKSPIPFAIAAGLVLLLPLLGKGGLLASAILLSALAGAPLFFIIGMVTVLSFILWGGFHQLNEFSVLIERIRTLADNPTLLAIPLFIMSGAVMSKGHISRRLIDFAEALVGWVPGGLAMSGVIACMLFAAISGSSPATVIAIGGMMGPTLLAANYSERFSHGLLTSAGSLGILIPPSIPMIIYPIVNQGSFIEVERLFASGIGPGLVIGSILMGFCFVQGVRNKTPRNPFALKKLGIALRDGFWALMFPALVLGGIYLGFFNAVEAAAISVVYAVVVEVFIHGAIRIRELPKIFQETGVFLGSLLVIMVAALAFSEFLEGQGIPQAMVEWIRSMNLSQWQFLIALNVLLLVVGMAMDILSAMFVFVPLLAPVATAMGVSPIHFGIIFIVNLEIGYLTPPVGLNLFVASALFEKPIGHMIRSVMPFIALMLVGLGLVTYVPAISIGLGDVIIDSLSGAPARPTPTPSSGPGMPLSDEPDEATPAGGDGHVQSLEEMMRELEGTGTDGEAGDGTGAAPSSADDGHVQSLEEMMREAQEAAP